MKLIVGLGNPGRRYSRSRHNVGFNCIDYIARKHDIPLDRRKSRSRIGLGLIEGEKVLLAKPRTFMNLSGEAIVALKKFYNTELKDIVIIYDDLDIPIGKIRIREKGSAGGHNGIKSIVAYLGGQEFPRIRVGIAPLELEEPRKTKTPKYVLGDFMSEEKSTIKEVYPTVAAAVECLITEGITAAMNKYN